MFTWIHVFIDINPQVVFDIYTFKITAASPSEQVDKYGWYDVILLKALQ